VRGLRTATQLYSICPHGLEDTFVVENFVGEGELGVSTYEPGHCSQFQVKVLALGLNVLPPGQLAFEV